MSAWRRAISREPGADTDSLGSGPVPTPFLIIILHNRLNYITSPIRAYSIVIRGITLWNELSRYIFSSPSIYIFKMKCGNFLIKPTT